MFHVLVLRARQRPRSTLTVDRGQLDDELRGIRLDRTADLAGFLAGREIGPVLQHVGQLVLDRLAEAAGDAADAAATTSTATGYDVLEESREVQLRRWFVFKEERALGRARLFLADEGYRAALGSTPG